MAPMLETTTLVLLLQFTYSMSSLLLNMVNYAFYILFGFIIAWILIGWFPRYPSTRFFQVIYEAVGNVVNPIMLPIRNRVPPLNLGGFALDLSPIIAIFGLYMGRILLTTIINAFIRPVMG